MPKFDSTFDFAGYPSRAVMISMPTGLDGRGETRLRAFHRAGDGFPQITGYGRTGRSSRGRLMLSPLEAFAVLAALRRRRTKGSIRPSQVDHQYPRGQEMIATPEPPKWSRIKSPPTDTPHGTARLERRWMQRDNDDQWQSLCRHVGRADWARRDDLAHLEGRLVAHDELDAGIEAWTVGREQRETARLLQEAGIAAGPVLGGADLLGDPQLNVRGFVDWLDREWVGKAPYNGMFAQFSTTPGSFRLPAPLLGEHNEKILKGLLTIEDDVYAQLEAEGVIGNVVSAQD
jgi:crotonobetainyl-CoA:carnitine CoA-transferase CaiB-like acyl-CoA transferase